MNKMKLALIPLMLLLCSVVVVSTASLAPVEKDDIEWLLVFEEQTDLDVRTLNEQIVWQRFNQIGAVYDALDEDELIGSITMQGKVVSDLGGNGRAHVKFVITLDEGEGSIKGVMNGDITQESEGQHINGRFNGSGAYHIHGTVVHQETPVVDTALLKGWAVAR